MRTPGPAGREVALDDTGLWPEVVRGVLGVDAELDRVAAQADVLLAVAERLAGGDADLLGDDVDARQHLGHRVLDLDAAVDLDEVEVAVAVEQELERAHVLVAGLDDGANGGLAERLAARRRRAPATGASSMIFWWRRWTEQSRSPTCTPLP